MSKSRSILLICWITLTIIGIIHLVMTFPDPYRIMRAEDFIGSEMIDPSPWYYGRAVLQVVVPNILNLICLCIVGTKWIDAKPSDKEKMVARTSRP